MSKTFKCGSLISIGRGKEETNTRLLSDISGTLDKILDNTERINKSEDLHLLIQDTKEELRFAKEELRFAKEELAVLRDELRKVREELSKVKDDVNRHNMCDNGIRTAIVVQRHQQMSSPNGSTFSKLSMDYDSH